MFESDEWDLDQDFLNDTDDKLNADRYETGNQETQHKRRKVEVFNDDISSDKNNAGNKDVRTCNNKDTRKNLILSIFQKNSTQNTISKVKESSANNLLMTNSNCTQNHENSQLGRKDLVLGILKKKNTQDAFVKDAKNSKLEKVQVDIKNKSSNVQQQESVSRNNDAQYKNKDNKDKTLNKDKFSLFETSRKQLLDNLLRKQTANNTEGRKNNASVNKLPRKRSNEKLTLVRRFPGPAGLLPDNIDVNVSPALYLNNMEENEQAKDAAAAVSSLPEYCSQNTETLFTEGAWQLMLNDLPDGFLKGYDIASIKEIANARKCYSTKANFLAGIIEHVDYSHENPPIILKDFSDSIDGIIHRDIPLKYPGLLEPNVVVLLHNVGLLKTSGSFTSGRYRILISPSNLLAIYSNDGQMEHTQYMESVLKGTSSGEIREPEEGEEVDQLLIKALEEQSNNAREKQNHRAADSGRTSSSFDVNSSRALDDANEMVDFDFPDDCSFAVSFDTIADNSETDTRFNNSALRNCQKINKRSNEQITAEGGRKSSENLLKSLKKFSPDLNVKKKFSHDSKGSPIDVERREPRVPATTSSSTRLEEELKPETLNNTSINKVDAEVKQLEEFRENRGAPVDGDKEKNRLSVRSKLLAYRNADTLTPSESKESSNEDKDNDIVRNKPTNKTWSSEMLCNSENDSDDEMLSQMDMNTIFSNYNGNG